MGAAIVHLARLSNLYLEKMHHPDRPVSITIGDMVEALTEQKQFPYHSHDLAIISKIPNQKTSALQHLPLHKCSVSMLPPRRFSYHQFPGVPKRPWDIAGLQNMGSLRLLDEQTRTEINDAQRHYGQKISGWTWAPMPVPTQYA